MTRTFKYALSAVLGFALVIPAFAQDNFPDVPENHWAYEALARMKREGLLVGYPDGLYRGSRSATRYEMAVAIHATYSYLKNLTDNLQSQIDALKANQGGTGGVSREEFDNLKAAVTALQNDLNNLKAQDIADLRKMATTFERELSALGVDVQQMKKDLADLSDRVTNLENRLPVDISGGIDFVLLAGYGTDDFGGLPGITVDARPTGIDRRTGNPGIGADRDLSILHEAAITLTGANKTGAKFKGTFVFSNMFEGEGGVAFGDQSSIARFGSSPFSFSPFREGDETMYIQNLSVAFDTSLYGAGLSAEAGRIGYKISPYIFQRPDNTPYYANDRWDNGEWNFDGAVLGFNFGSAKLKILGGRTLGNSSNATVGVSSSFQPMPGVGGNTDQFLGIHASVPITENGSLNLAYLWLDSNASTAVADDKLAVFGGDLSFNFGEFMVNAGYAQTNTMDGDSTVIDDDNKEFHVNVGYNANRWGVNVGYRSIDPQFMAPGDWGRIGTFWNPTDIKGFMANAHFDLTNDIRLTGKVESYTGIDDEAGFGGTNAFLSEDDEIMRYVFGLEYKLATNYDLALGVEEVRMNFDDAGNLGGFGNDKVIQRWYNIGFGWSISDNAKLKFLWQVSDYKALEANPAVQPFGGAFGAAARGGLITTQLSVKF